MKKKCVGNKEVVVWGNAMKQNEMLLWLAGTNYVKIRTHCEAQHLMAQHGETRIDVFEAELNMDASQTVRG